MTPKPSGTTAVSQLPGHKNQVCPQLHCLAWRHMKVVQRHNPQQQQQQAQQALTAAPAKQRRAAAACKKQQQRRQQLQGRKWL